MRAFSEIERKIIRRMIELDEKPRSLNVLGNILHSFYGESHLPDYCYIQVSAPDDVAIMVRSEELNAHGGDWLQDIDKKISKLLLTTVTLFEYLEANGLAFFVGDLNFNSLGETWVPTDYVRCEFLEPESKSLIYKYTRKKIYVSETLKVLECNGFKSPEEVRHEREQSAIKRQLLYTQVALGFSFVGLVLSLLVPMFVTTVVDIKNKTISVSPDRMFVREAESLIDNGASKTAESISSIQRELSTQVARQSKAIEDVKTLVEALSINVRPSVEANVGHNNQVNKDASR